jgi:hypothetical protein
MWTLINLLLTLDKRSIVKQGTLDYFCLTGKSNNKVLLLKKIKKSLDLVFLLLLFSFTSSVGVMRNFELIFFFLILEF